MLNPQLIYQDDNFLVIEKPAGLLVHGGPHIKSKESTLVDWLLSNFPGVKNVGDDPKFRPGIVHRLDKTTSGLMVIARNQKTFDELKRLFQERLISKKYQALVKGKIPSRSGIINFSIVKSKSEKSFAKRRIAKKGEEGKPAETRWQIIKEKKDFTLLEVEPKTGRTHQIRVHLSASGHPVVGDKFYGKDKKTILKRPFLHAVSLAFSLFGSSYKFESSLPKDLQGFLDGLE